MQKIQIIKMPDQYGIISYRLHFLADALLLALAVAFISIYREEI